MSKLAIDFDGVIHDHKHPIEGRKMGGPIEGAPQALARFRDQGHEVIIHSVNNKDVIAKWMSFYGLHYDEITNIKPNADYYIDDKAIHFESWTKLLNFLNSQTSFQNS